MSLTRAYHQIQHKLSHPQEEPRFSEWRPTGHRTPGPSCALPLKTGIGYAAVNVVSDVASGPTNMIADEALGHRTPVSIFSSHHASVVELLFTKATNQISVQLRSSWTAAHRRFRRKVHLRAWDVVESA